MAVVLDRILDDLAEFQRLLAAVLVDVLGACLGAMQHKGAGTSLAVVVIPANFAQYRPW